MPQTLGLIGSGLIGTSLARLAVAAGLEVVLSNSRGPETLADLVTDLGGRTRAATPAEAARAGDQVVVATPLKAYAQLPVDAMAGKTVIDTMNYAPSRDGRIADLDTGALTSSDLLQRHLVDARVVKAVNNIGAHQLLTLARPASAPDRSALPLAGDSTEAKWEAARLFDALGYDTVDIGTLAESWRLEPGSPLVATPYLGEAPEELSAEQWYRWAAQATGIPVPAERVRELAHSAVRGQDSGNIPALER